MLKYIHTRAAGCPRGCRARPRPRDGHLPQPPKVIQIFMTYPGHFFPPPRERKFSGWSEEVWVSKAMKFTHPSRSSGAYPYTTSAWNICIFSDFQLTSSTFSQYITALSSSTTSFLLTILDSYTLYVPPEPILTLLGFPARIFNFQSIYNHLEQLYSWFSIEYT